MSVGSVPKYFGCIILSMSVILPSVGQSGCWLCEKLTNVQKIPYSAVVKKMKKYSHTDPDHHQKLTTSRGSPLAHV